MRWPFPASRVEHTPPFRHGADAHGSGAASVGFAHAAAAVLNVASMPIMVRRLPHVSCIGSSTVAHSVVHAAVGNPEVHSAASLQHAPVITCVYAKNSEPVLHGGGGGARGHSAAAVSITPVIPIIVTMSAQSRCIGSRSAAPSAVHDDGRPPSHGWSSSQHAAVTAAERAKNSGPVHCADVVGRRPAQRRTAAVTMKATATDRIILGERGGRGGDL